MICHKRRFIFIHIPKTGGSSLGAVLGDEWQNHRDLGRYRRELPREQFEEYFKFTITRNPWDRLVSEYVFQTRLGGSRSGKLHAYDEAGRPLAFDSWLERVLNDPEPTHARTWGGSVSPGIHRWSPQVDWISIDGEIGVDFIARTERLDADARSIAERLAIELPPLPREKRMIRRHYSAYYTPETRKIVGELYASDIEAFGYEFEASSEPRFLGAVMDGLRNLLRGRR